MYKLRTTKQLKYFDEVIRLHYEKGYGEDRISTLLPVGHTTVSRPDCYLCISERRCATDGREKQ